MCMTPEWQENALRRLIEYEAIGEPNEQFVLSEIKKRLEFVPGKKLYKFRKVNNINLASLSKNEIWLPCASCFPDAFDTTVNIDLEQDAPIVETLLFEKAYAGFESWFKSISGIPNCFSVPSLEDFLQFKNEHPEDDLETNAESIYKFMSMHCDIQGTDFDVEKLKYIFRLGTSIFQKMREDLEGKLNKLSNDFEKARESLRTSKAVYCMSETIDNPKQWEDYADMYQGFAIEYSFDDIDDTIILQNDILLSLFPIVYTEKRPRFELSLLAEHIRKQLPTNLEHEEGLELETKVFMHMFYKDRRYDSECEWRIFCCCENGQGVSLKFPFVSAIYVGKDIKPRNLSRLRNIAKQLDVPIYKQRINRFKNGYEYIDV